MRERNYLQAHPAAIGTPKFHYVHAAAGIAAAAEAAAGAVAMAMGAAADVFGAPMVQAVAAGVSQWVLLSLLRHWVLLVLPRK